MPRAVAMAIDHCFGAAGLHRVEISIRPENTNSLRVVEKLGLHEVGLAPRFLHIDGAWRDHRIYAVTVEECAGGCWPARRLDRDGRAAGGSSASLGFVPVARHNPVPRPPGKPPPRKPHQSHE